MLILNLFKKGSRVVLKMMILHTRKKIDLVNQLFFTGKKNAINRFLEPILKEMNYFKNMMKKHFKKNLVMSKKDEERFQLSSMR